MLQELPTHLADDSTWWLLEFGAAGWGFDRVLSNLQTHYPVHLPEWWPNCCRGLIVGKNIHYSMIQRLCLFTGNLGWFMMIRVLLVFPISPLIGAMRPLVDGALQVQYPQATLRLQQQQLNSEDWQRCSSGMETLREEQGYHRRAVCGCLWSQEI